MPGPNTPSVASPVVPPPIGQTAIVDGKGFLTPAGLNFLQLLWAGVFGHGGLADTTLLIAVPPGITTAQAESLFESVSDQKSSLSSLAGRFGPVQQALESLQKLAPIPSLCPTDSPSMISWTPTIAGSTTPGAQTYATQWGGFAHVGPFIIALFSIVLSAFDGTTAGNILIEGLPFAANNAISPQGCGWLSQWGGMTLTANYTMLGITIDLGTSSFHVTQGGSAQNSVLLDVSALSASSTLIGGAVYFP